MQVRAEPPPKVYLAMVLHLHQPVLRANSGSIDKCYAVIPKIYADYPSVKVTLNLQGLLIDQLAEIRPSVLDIYRPLVKSGQVELLASGYYHPILPLLPDISVRKQIAKDIVTVQKYFDVTPEGIWFPECGFSCDLIPVLNSFGLKYGVIEQKGLTGVSFPKQIEPHNIANQNGFVVFPRDFNISNVIIAFGKMDPMQRAMDVIEAIDSTINNFANTGISHPIIVLATDGETIGEHWDQGAAFLNHLLKYCILKKDSDIETVTLGEYYHKYGPYGSLNYIPPSTWAADPPENFDWWNSSIFALHIQDRNDESRNMIIAAEKQGKNLAQAWDYLGRAEGSEWSYPSLEPKSDSRGIAYTHSIMAQLEAEKFVPIDLNIRVASSRIKTYKQVVILENKCLKIFVAPSSGGRIIELDSKITKSNLVNTYYWSWLIKNDYRNALTDGIYDLSPTALAFVNYSYELEKTADLVSLKLKHTITSGPYKGLQIHKTLTLRSNFSNFEVLFKLVNTGDQNLTFRFTNEWCLTPGGYLDDKDRITFREGANVWQTTGAQPQDVYGNFSWAEVEDQDLTRWWDDQPSNKQEYSVIFLDGQVDQLHVETPSNTTIFPTPGNIIKFIYKATALKPGESHTFKQNFATGFGNHMVFDRTPAKELNQRT